MLVCLLGDLRGISLCWLRGLCGFGGSDSRVYSKVEISTYKRAFSLSRLRWGSTSDISEASEDSDGSRGSDIFSTPRSREERSET